MVICDDCEANVPLIDGFHVREPNPEGIEGIVRVPCPNAVQDEVEGNECE